VVCALAKAEWPWQLVRRAPNLHRSAFPLSFIGHTSRQWTCSDPWKLHASWKSVQLP
jgi:hypothetical protein